MTSFISGFFSSSSKPASPASEADSAKKAGKKILVIVSGGKKGSSNWEEIFSKKTLDDGTPVTAFSAQWEDLNCTAYGESKAPLQISIYDRTEKRLKNISPDIILVRAEVRGFTFGVDFRNFLYAFKFGQVPMVNSATALIQMMDRPWLHAELIAIRNRVGQEKFPLINRKLKLNVL
jgi:hypothetical protein